MGNSPIEMVWLDLETTGLESLNDEILEIAIVGTDRFGDDARVLFDEIVIPPRWQSCRDEMYPVVLEMHTKSGLIADIEAATYDPHYCSKEQVEQRILEQLRASLPDSAHVFPMCGNTIHFDRSFLLVDMPELHNWFNYRNVDVSTLKNVCRLVNPSVYEGLPEKSKRHRALGDIFESIEEYKFYLDNFLHVAYIPTLHGV